MVAFKLVAADHMKRELERAEQLHFMLWCRLKRLRLLTSLPAYFLPEMGRSLSL